MSWTWLGRGLAVAGTGVGLYIVELITSPKTQIVSIGGAPDPNNASAADKVMFPCEAVGGTCTCDDVRDWLNTYWTGTETQVGLKVLNDEANTLSVKASPSDVEAHRLVLTVKELVRYFKKNFEPVDEYDCNDTWWVAKAGKDTIIGIVTKIKKVQVLQNEMHDRLFDLAQPGELVAVPPNFKGIHPDILDDGDGPDSGSIGLGLLAGGAIALALIMGQSKTKGPV